MAYQVQINEQQRAIIERALALLVGNAGSELPADDHNEVEILHGLFKDLPAGELDMQEKYGHQPGQTLHGFCL